MLQPRLLSLSLSPPTSRRRISIFPLSVSSRVVARRKMVQILSTKNASVKAKNVDFESCSARTNHAYNLAASPLNHDSKDLSLASPSGSKSSSSSILAVYASSPYTLPIAGQKTCPPASSTPAVHTASETQKSQRIYGFDNSSEPLCDIQGLFLPPASRGNNGRRSGDPPDSSTFSFKLHRPLLQNTKKVVHFSDGGVSEEDLGAITTPRRSSIDGDHAKKDLVRDTSERNSPTTTTTTTTTSLITLPTHSSSVADTIGFSPEASASAVAAAATAYEESSSTVSSSPLSSVSSSILGSQGDRTPPRPQPFRPLNAETSCDLIVSHFRESINVDIITILHDLWSAIQNLSISVSLVTIGCLSSHWCPSSQFTKVLVAQKSWVLPLLYG